MVKDKVEFKNNYKPLLQLTGGLLWNFNVEKMDYIRDKRQIIERILDAGVENDEIIMWKLYSYEDIKKIALNMENLHREKVTYTAFVLKIDEKKFKSYGKKMWYEK